jgi:hypothetical protein
MYLRRGAAGDETLAEPYLGPAAAQFNQLGMTGWTKRAERLMHDPRKVELQAGRIAN